MRTVQLFCAIASLATAASAADMRQEREPLPMRVGEQRIVLGALAENTVTAHPDRVRTVRLPGLGIHLRAVAPGEAALIWGQPPRLYARFHVDPAPVRDIPPPLRAVTPAQAWSQPAILAPAMDPAMQLETPAAEEYDVPVQIPRRRAK